MTASKVECPLCGAEVGKTYLPSHTMQFHPAEYYKTPKKFMKLAPMYCSLPPPAPEQVPEEPVENFRAQGARLQDKIVEEVLQ